MEISGQQMAFFNKLVAERDRVYSDRIKVRSMFVSLEDR